MWSAITTGRPVAGDASPYHLGYINQVEGDDILHVLDQQLTVASEFFATYTEDASLYRYAPDKWSVRQALNHITDTERIFAFRALWIARGTDGALLSFDQQTAAEAAEADTIPFASHLEEFSRVRLATLSLFANLPAAGWSRSGIASDHRFTTRALAFVIAGHLEHHLKILRERYTT
jgi:hypothetical protein